MAKPAPSLAGVLDDLPTLPLTDNPSRKRYAAATSETVLVGANLDPAYARNLAFLHAETGLTKKELLQQALDLFFTSKGGPRRTSP